jgi:hypothetical protein
MSYWGQNADNDPWEGLMPNMRHAFKDRDIRRLVKAARSAGLEPISVEVDVKAGKIRVTGNATAPAASGDTNPWDEALHGSDEKRTP